MSSSYEEKGAPPPYVDDQASPAHDSTNTGSPSEPPPAYEHDSPEPRPPVSDTKQPPLQNHSRTLSRSSAGPSTAPEAPPPPRSSSSSSNPFSNLRTAYKEKQRAKMAATKVDYYEKIYGFVPKNVMSEAEWKDARDRAPKVKKPIELGARSYFGPPRG